MVDDERGQQDYVRQVLEAYRSTPGTTGTVRRPDRMLAAQLFRRGVAVGVMTTCVLRKVGVRVSVGLMVSVAEIVTVGECVKVGVAVGVRVGVRVGVLVSVAVGVTVGVGVASRKQ